MISKKYRFIYIHIPKTGGNSLQSALGPYSDDKLVFRKSIGAVVNEDGLQGLDVFNEELGLNDPKHKHASIQDYYSILGDEIYSYYIFTSVRNPWDRVISQTAFLSKGALPIRKLAIDELSLPNLMVDYVSINGRVVINESVRFENLKSDFARLCRRLGLPELDIPHKNRSLRDDYRKYYSDDMVDYVAEKYKLDIDYFGYNYGG